jgi:NADH-quinone oxidoreductase subunit J
VADKVEKPSRHIEAILGVVGLVILVAFIFAIFGTKVLPGLAPVAASGAEIAKPSDLVFYIFAAGAIVSGAGVAFSRNIIYSCLALLGTLLSAGALYVYLNADYVAVTQLLIYIGGVLVLILFAVMLTSQIGDKTNSNPISGMFPGLVLLLAMIGIFGFVATKTPWLSKAEPLQRSETATTIGNLFLGRYLLPFEVSSLVLLATLIGAVVVARKEIKE